MDGTLESIWELLNWREKRRANPGDIPHDDILLPDLGFDTKKIVKLLFYKQDYALALRILGRLKDVAGSKRRVAWHYFEDGKERLVVTKEDDPEKLKKKEELKKRSIRSEAAIKRAIKFSRYNQIFADYMRVWDKSSKVSDLILSVHNPDWPLAPICEISLKDCIKKRQPLTGAKRKLAEIVRGTKTKKTKKRKK